MGMTAHEAKRRRLQTEYLKALAALKHVRKACEAVGIVKSATTKWRKRYADFREAEQAVLQAIARGETHE